MSLVNRDTPMDVKVRIAHELYTHNKLTTKEISRRMGVDSHSVLCYLRRAGVDTQTLQARRLETIKNKVRGNGSHDLKTPPKYAWHAEWERKEREKKMANRKTVKK